MQLLRPAVTLLLLSLLAISCEQGPGFEDITEKTPGIRSFSIEPGVLDFEPEDGIKDSLTTFSIRVEPEDPEQRGTPRLVIRPQDSRDTYFETDITGWNEETGRFEDDVQVEFFTAQVRNYEAYLFIPQDQKVGDRGQQTIKVDGFSAEPPVVEEVDHPEEVQIPDEGEDQFLIAARVTHPFGADNIALVELDIVDSSGSSIGQFELDSDEAQDAGYGDDWYATGFTISDDNQPETYTLKFYAEDTTPAVSDTVTSSMEFVR